MNKLILVALLFGCQITGYSQAVWLPDQSGVVYTQKGNFYIHYLDSDSVIQLTNDEATQIHKSISPGGSRIVYDTDEDGNMEIYSMNIDGSSPQRLTTNEGWDLVPVWSRDGKQIAFNSTRDGNWDVYLMNDMDPTRSI